MKFIVFLLALSEIAFSQSARVLTRGEATSILLPMPRPRPGTPLIPAIWSGRSILTIIVNDTPTPVINSTAPDGRNEEIRFSIPGWSNFVLVSLWGGDEGEIVTAGSAVDDHGDPSGCIVRIGRNRGEVTMMPVKEISIRAMTVGPGGVIWAVGSGKDKETDMMHNNILARFSPDGRLLSSTILQFPIVRGIEVEAAASSQMRASADRIAWLTSEDEYFEFATDGHELIRISGPEGPRYNRGRLAVSFGNTALISKEAARIRNQPPKLNIWALDRIKQQWFLSEPSDGAFPLNTAIYGFDGNTLMTSGFSKSTGSLLVRYTLSETK